MQFNPRIIKTILFLALFLSGFVVIAQKQDNIIERIKNGTVLTGDTIPVYELKPVEVQARYSSKYRRRIRHYNRLTRKVKKVYPYAKYLELTIDSIDSQLASFTTEAQRKAFIKQEEKLLFLRFESELKKMTVSEGIILVKLIDRQTGDTSYELIKELKGRITAFFWQGIALFFGNNLKANYDAEEEDRMIEDIVRRIEAGEL